MSDRVVSLTDAKRAARGGRNAGPPGERAGAAGECPVTPLGHRDGSYFFFDVAGQLRALSAQAIGQSPQIVALFGGEMGWCEMTFPQLDKEGQPTGWFSVRAVGRHLVERCTAIGLFRPEEPRRGIGVWRAEGQVLIHLGDRIFSPASGQSWPAGFRAHGALWPALPKSPAPAAAATTAVAERVEALLGRWRWQSPNAPAIMFGLWAAGLLGAAIRWRPHGMVIGPAGSGKTTLMEFYAALSPLAMMWNDYTEAGLRQALTGRASPLMLDEAEGDTEGVGKLQRVVELLRRASSGAGAQTVRGSAGGVSQTFEVTCAALLGAILPPDLLPQDASRFTVVELDPRAPGGLPLPSAGEIAEMREAAPALWGRALAGIERFAGNLDRLKAEILGRGCESRLADQIGTILAARAMMLRDEPLSEADAADEMDAFRELAQPAETQAEDSGPAAALRHLLQSSADLTKHGERPTVGALLARGQRDDPDGDDARRILAEHGLLLAPWPRSSTGPRCLYISNTHPRLGRIYEGTRWGARRWRVDLARLPGAWRPPDTQRIGRAKDRCVVIGPEHLPEPDRSSLTDEPPG